MLYSDILDVKSDSILREVRVTIRCKNFITAWSIDSELIIVMTCSVTQCHAATAMTANLTRQNCEASPRSDISTATTVPNVCIWDFVTVYFVFECHQLTLVGEPRVNSQQHAQVATLKVRIRLFIFPVIF